MRTAALVAVLVLAAPAAAADPSPRQRGDLAVRARDILRRHCAECHGEKPRRGDLSVVSHAKLVEPPIPVPLLNPTNPPKSLLLQLISDGSMPPGGRAGPTAGEVDELTAWIKAGAPGYPAAFGDAYAADAAKRDWDGRPSTDRPFLRYLSYAHQLADGLTPPNLPEAEEKLRTALRAATGKDVPTAPADPAATVFRLDLRTAGWDRGDLFDKMEKGVPVDAHPLTAFDVLMLEYPHAAGAGSEAIAKMAAGMNGVRKVPVVRADWLTPALTPTAPLTEELRSLADLVPGKEPCGPRPGRFFNGPGLDGRPLEAWHAGDPAGGAFSLKVEFVTGEAFDTATTEVKVGEPHKLKITAGRAVRVRVLRVLANGKASYQNLEKDAIPANDPTLLGPNTNGKFKAGNVSSGGQAETDYYVVLAAADVVPIPVLLRSRHVECVEMGRYPMWRFLFEPSDVKFDPSLIVRRVVPLTVRQP